MSRIPTRSQDSPPAEPTAGAAPAPVWLYVLLGLLVFWGMRYLDEQGGGFNAQVYRPHRSMVQLQALLPKSEGDLLFAGGQQIYAKYCSICHQPTGQGSPAQQAPPLAESEWVEEAGAGRLIRLVLNGIQGPITVKGQPYNGAMPPWRDILTDDDIAAVLTYVRGNANWGNSAPAVTPEQVKAVREKTASRGNAWSPDELLQVPAAD
jgi:mono/diheme cytochrome c family protein